MIFGLVYLTFHVDRMAQYEKRDFAFIDFINFYLEQFIGRKTVQACQLISGRTSHAPNLQSNQQSKHNSQRPRMFHIIQKLLQEPGKLSWHNVWLLAYHHLSIPGMGRDFLYLRAVSSYVSGFTSSIFQMTLEVLPSTKAKIKKSLQVQASLYHHTSPWHDYQFSTMITTVHVTPRRKP